MNVETSFAFGLFVGGAVLIVLDRIGISVANAAAERRARSEKAKAERAAGAFTQKLIAAPICCKGFSSPGQCPHEAEWKVQTGSLVGSRGGQ